MITLHVHYENRTEYYPMKTKWAANLAAMDILKTDPNVLYVDLVDHSTMKIEKHHIYKRGDWPFLFFTACTKFR